MDIIQHALVLAPVPGLSVAFSLFRHIWTSVQEVQASNQQLQCLASLIAQLLRTLDSQYRSGHLSEAGTCSQLKDLSCLLKEISEFICRQSSYSFLKSMCTKQQRIMSIDGYHRRITNAVASFQISALLDIQDWQSMNDKAQAADQNLLSKRLDDLERNQNQLLDVLLTTNAWQNNIVSTLASLQKQLKERLSSDREQQFYEQSLRHLSNMSGIQVELDTWTITSFEVDMGPKIGSGGFGQILKGTWNKTPVAIKVFRMDNGITPALSVMRQEVEIWSKLIHPHILQFLGANVLDDTPFIVMPYYRNGNAREYIRSHPACNRVAILCDMSCGLLYLHSKQVVHGDLKAPNVLVDDGGRAVLCDFGLSRVMSDVNTRTATAGIAAPVGSRNWMAPELLIGGRLRKPCDIYAFGMTIYEIYVDDVPLGHISYADFIELVVRQDVRPERLEGDGGVPFPDGIWDLAESCWRKTPTERPTAIDIFDMLSHFVDAGTPTHLSMPNPALADRKREKFNRVESSGVEVREGRKIALETKHPDVLDSLRDQAFVCWKQGKLDEAESLLAQVVEVRKRVLGTEHPDTLSSIYYLAVVYQQQDKLDKAESLQSQVEEVRKRILGVEHPDTLSTIHYLALTYQKQGKLDKAERLQSWVVGMRKRILGAEHPKTLVSIHDLAVTYWKQDKFDKAGSLLAHVVEVRKKILGAEHPDTLSSIHNLAVMYQKQKKLDKAESLLSQVVDVRKRILGAEHPDTLSSIHNLAVTHKEQGKLDKAESLQPQVVEVRKRILGAKHPDTLSSIHVLAVIYQKQGKLDKAESLQSQTVEVRKRVLGAEHPDTLSSIYSLAVIYKEQGKLDKAESLLAQVVDVRKRILGAEHPKTLVSIHNLAVTYKEQDKLDKAESLQSQEVEVRKRVLGAEHPDTLSSIYSLAVIYKEQGKLDKAESLLAQVVDMRKRILGAEHPDTLSSINVLAPIYQEQGKLDKAESLLSQVVEVKKKSLGAEHPDTLLSIHNLAVIHQQLLGYLMIHST